MMNMEDLIRSLRKRNPNNTLANAASSGDNVSTETAEIQLKLPLKWAGGKRWLVPELEPIWVHHSHRRLVEPLCGGLAVTLALMPQRALANDINPHLINFFKWLKRGLEVTLDLRNDEDAYYEARDRFNELVHAEKSDTREAAQLFYYMNRTGYNGLCRFNLSGEFNVPFGRYKTINYVDDFLEYKPVFENWEFTAGDFEEIVLEPQDFIYADPPYDVPFTKYAKEDFTWDEQVRLAEWLANHAGPVALSNQATDRIVELYEDLGFGLRYLEGPRRISCTGDRTPAQEVLATKNTEH